MNQINSNEELVADLMQYGKYGALNQAFIMTAIQKYADTVSKADPAIFDTAFMNGAAWVGCAKDIKERCDAFYGRLNGR